MIIFYSFSVLQFVQNVSLFCLPVCLFAFFFCVRVFLCFYSCFLFFSGGGGMVKLILLGHSLFIFLTQIQPTFLNITECDVGNSLNKISLRPTIPIRGGDVIVKFGTIDNFTALYNTKCEIALQPSDEHKWIDISVQAACDNTNLAFAPSAFTFTVTSTHDDLALFWGLYELPPVVVRTFQFFFFFLISGYTDFSIKVDRTSFSRVRSLVTSARVTLHTHKSRARFEKAKQHGGAV